MSKPRLSTVKPTKDRLLELDRLAGLSRYRIHVLSDWVACYLEFFPTILNPPLSWKPVIPTPMNSLVPFPWKFNWFRMRMGG